MPRCQQHFKDDSPGCADRPWTSAVLLVVMCGLLLLILAAGYFVIEAGRPVRKLPAS